MVVRGRRRNRHPISGCARSPGSCVCRSRRRRGGASNPQGKAGPPHEEAAPGFPTVERRAARVRDRWRRHHPRAAAALGDLADARADQPGNGPRGARTRCHRRQSSRDCLRDPGRASAAAPAHVGHGPALRPALTHRRASSRLPAPVSRASPRHALLRGAFPVWAWLSARGRRIESFRHTRSAEPGGDSTR